MPEQEANATPKRDPRALSAEYHKARKQLMLWAAILFIWELVGVDLNKAIATGGNVGAIVNSIKSPQAVPWALLILVGYFVFKLRIEWMQCSEKRRQVREAKMDYYSACIVALAACVLYFGQTMSHIQFANVIQRFLLASSAMVGITIGVGLSAIGLLLWRRKLREIRKLR